MQIVKKKILFVITQSEMGGAQRWLLTAAPWFKDQGYEVSVAAGPGGEQFFELLAGLKTIRLKHLKRLPNPLKALQAIFEIRGLIKKEQPNVLFLCSTMAGVLGSIAGRPFHKKGLRVIYRIGGWAFNDPRPSWQKKLILFLEKKTSQYKDKIIVNCQFDLDCGLKYKVASAEKLIKIYNGIDPASIDFLPKDQARHALAINVLRSHLKTLVIGTIANFYKTKGLEYLIKAAAEMTKARPLSADKGRAFVAIIGDGEERKNLEKLIKEYKLEDRIKLLGRIPDARKYLKAFDVFVLPSLKEGFPWAILEAMSAGVPIVATKVGAVPEIIENNQSGFLVEPGNSQVLAKKITELINNPELQNKFVKNANQRLPQFSQQKMLEQFKKVVHL